MLSAHDAPILLVEDSDEDWEALRRALVQLDVRAPLKRFSQGPDALGWLREAAAHGSARALPRLILLDLNLPGMSGLEVLGQIKQHAVLRMIPLLVLTSSSNPHDVRSTYLGGANSYLVKPFGFDALANMLKQVRHFWMETALLPRFVDA